MRWSHVDYHRMIDAGVFQGRRVELFDGEIVQMAPQSEGHFFSVHEATEALRNCVPKEFSVYQQMPCKLDPDTEREPDVVVIEGKWSAESFPSKPTLVVEVSVRTLEHDRIVKSSLYSLNSIPTYWIVDVQGRRLEVRTKPVESADAPFGWDYGDVTIYEAGDSVPLPMTPDVAVDVEDLLPPV